MHGHMNIRLAVWKQFLAHIFEILANICLLKKMEFFSYKVINTKICLQCRGTVIWLSSTAIAFMPQVSSSSSLCTFPVSMLVLVPHCSDWQQQQDTFTTNELQRFSFIATQLCLSTSLGRLYIHCPLYAFLTSTLREVFLIWLSFH
jgi:hypothetical protein